MEVLLILADIRVLGIHQVPRPVYVLLYLVYTNNGSNSRASRWRANRRDGGGNRGGVEVTLILYYTELPGIV